MMLPFSIPSHTDREINDNSTHTHTSLYVNFKLLIQVVDNAQKTREK